MGIYAIGIAPRSAAPSDRPPSRQCHTATAKLLLGGVKPAKRAATTRDSGLRQRQGEKLTGSGKLDHSVSQYGILGLWACAKNGVDIDSKDWKMFEEVAEPSIPDGAWNTRASPPNPDPKPKKEAQREKTLSMTHRRRRKLFIINDFLHSDDGINCRGNLPTQNIDKGWTGSAPTSLRSSTAKFDAKRASIATPVRHRTHRCGERITNIWKLSTGMPRR